MSTDTSRHHLTNADQVSDIRAALASGDSLHPYPPDPYGEDDSGIKIFDPGRARFRSVALVEFCHYEPRLLRGSLPGHLPKTRLQQAAIEIDALPGEVFGVLTNALGDLVLAEQDIDIGYDVRFEREIVIDFTVPQTDSSPDIRHALDEIATSLARTLTELDRTLAAGWRVFHVQSGVDTRISCYDPHFRP